MADQSNGAATGLPPGAARPDARGGAPVLQSATNRPAQNGAMKPSDAAATPAADLSAKSAAAGDSEVISLLGIEFNPAKPELEAHLNPWVAAVLIAGVTVYFLAQRRWRRGLKTFEIEKAELGIRRRENHAQT